MNYNPHTAGFLQYSGLDTVFQKQYQQERIIFLISIGRTSLSI